MSSHSFYKNVTPVNKQRHAQWAIATSNRFHFASSINSVPLTAIEFPAAAKDYAIVFAQSGDGLMPIAITGLRSGENLYVNAEGLWQEKYVPAFIRRYPFIFSTADEGKTLTLCLDEEFEGCNTEGKGDRLFSDTGENSDYLTRVVGFLQDYQGFFVRTQAFCKKLEELNVLEPMGAQYKTPDGREGSLRGFMVINRDKVKALPNETLAELVKSDELELMYLQINSMQNLRDTIKRVAVEPTGEFATA
jgi:SapC